MNWTDLAVTLTAEQRLHAGRERDGGNVLRSWPYLPGGLLRGALVLRWILAAGVEPQHATGERRQEFEELYEHGMLPGPLLPAGSQIIPASVQRCSRPVTADCGSVWCDTAEAAIAGLADSDLLQCPECDGAVEYGKGQTRPDVLTSHSRNADPGPAGQVFTAEVFPRGTTFRGQLSLWGQRGTALATELAAGETTLFVGGDISVYGRTTLTSAPAAPACVPPAPAPRVGIRLDAATVLTGVYGEPALSFAQAVDSFAVPAETGALVTPTVVRAWTRTTLLTGWHLPSNMGKPADYALAAGSTAVLRYDPPLTGPQLRHLVELRAVGHRTSEGYGRFTLLGPPPVAAP
jgi:CRISPR-associated protein Csx10